MLERILVSQVLGAFEPNRSRREITTLSIEELPKRERRLNPALTSSEVLGLVRTIKINELTMKAAKFRSEAAHHTMMANHYEGQAKNIDLVLAAIRANP